MTSIVEAADSGDHLELLRRMQKRIATAVDDESTPARDLAALTRRLQDVSKEIAALEERARLEGKPNGRTGTAKTKAGKFDPESV